jgi:MarR family transcriptional regulator, organic hydroperoxide resistance regulator
LTDNGKKIIKQAVKTVEAFDAEFFSVLGEKIPKFNKQLGLLLSQRDS